jgi:hypothetical protein
LETYHNLLPISSVIIQIGGLNNLINLKKNILDNIIESFYKVKKFNIMPRKYAMVRGRKMRGGSKFTKRLMSWMGSANSFLKRSGLISALGKEYLKSNPSAYGNVGLHLASQLGYGKKRMVRRRMVGSSLAPVGGAFKYGRR